MPTTAQEWNCMSLCGGMSESLQSRPRTQDGGFVTDTPAKMGQPRIKTIATPENELSPLPL